MALVSAAFDAYKSHEAVDPRNASPVLSFYRYSGPQGPAYVGWTDDDAMTWVDGPQVGPANLDWGPGVPLATVDEQVALAAGVSLRFANEEIRVSGPFGKGVFLKLETETEEWSLEAIRYKSFNRRLWRGAPAKKELLALLSNGPGKRNFRAKVAEDIRSHEVAVLALCWASLLPTVKVRGDIDLGSWSNYGDL